MNDIIELSPGMCLPHPMNRKVTEADVKELVVSITTGGQITPILVRPHPTIAGHYEIAAGCRRTLACTLAGVPVKANVRAMDDMEIEEILIIENLQRKDLDPLDEAEKLAMLVAGGHDVAKFAAGLGKSTAWLKSRMRLTNLDKTVAKDVKGKWPLELIEALSDYPAVTQKIILDKYRWNGPKSVKEIRSAGKTMAIRVDNVEWLADSRTANGKCGAGGCTTTDGDMLFKEAKNCINCMNPDCFKKRHAKHLKILIEELIALYPNRVLVREDIFRLVDNQLGAVPKGVKQVERWHKREVFGTACKEPDDASFAMVEMTSSDHSVVWFFHKKEEVSGKDGKKAPGGPLDASKDSRPDKVAMLKGKRFMALLEAVTAALEEYKIGPSFLIDLVAAFGTRINFERDGYDHGDRWAMRKAECYSGPTHHEALGKLKKVDARIFVTELVRQQMLARLKTNLNPSRAAEDKPLVAEVENLSEYIGFPMKETLLRIAAEFPPAKSWADEVDPLTLKPKKGKAKDVTAAEVGMTELQPR